jgi:hypothetical protein
VISEVLHSGIMLQMFVGDCMQFRPKLLKCVSYESRLKAKFALRSYMAEYFALMPRIQKVLGSNLMRGFLDLCIKIPLPLRLNSSYFVG